MSDKTGEKTAPVPLHFRFPVPKDEKGSEFTHCDEFLDYLSGHETGGYWPVGRNGLWHSAIHITNASAPWCALSTPAAENPPSSAKVYAGEQPLRCMADGEVVAYRVCSDLKENRWWGRPVPHACSFVLIRHYVQPGETPQSGLTFYTLYMNLAPWSAYTHDSTHNWTVNWPSGLKSFADKFRAWQTGTLPRGTKITWDNTDPSLKSEDGGTVMGYVTLRQDVHTADMDLQAGDKVWVSVRDAANLKPESGGAKRPVWWEMLLPPHQHTLELDKVVCPAPVPVKAGDAIGHLGRICGPGPHLSSALHEEYQVHIECFTADPNLANFLTNPEKVGRDKPDYLKFIPDVTAYDYSGWPMKFEPRKAPSTLDAVQRLADEARSAKDGFTGQLYWCSGQKMDWIRDEDTKKISRFDLAEQGFEQVDIPTTGFKYLGENRSRKGFIQKLMQVLHYASKQIQISHHGALEFDYQRHLWAIDDNENYDRLEMLQWLYVPVLRHSLNRLIIRHMSEWAHASHAMWEEEHLSDYRKNDPGEAEYWDTTLQNEVWMSDLDKSKVSLPAELWHMHPIVFLSTLNTPAVSGWAHSPFADLLGRVESKNDYTAYNKIFHHPKKRVESHYNTNLTTMTLQEVMDGQHGVNSMFAVGRFQVIPGTLQEAVKALKLNPHALFDEHMQDEIFEGYLIKIKRPDIIAYLEGDGSVEDAIYAWAMEFASAGVRKGKTISKGRTAQIEGVSYYSGDGFNRSHIMPDEMVSILEASKNGKK